jgi:hypothetical protein
MYPYLNIQIAYVYIYILHHQNIQANAGTYVFICIKIVYLTIFNKKIIEQCKLKNVLVVENRASSYANIRKM